MIERKNSFPGTSMKPKEYDGTTTSGTMVKVDVIYSGK